MNEAAMHAAGRQRRAAIYARVSTTKQGEDGTSLETQEERCRAHAAAHGYEVASVYREVHSGAELFERPQLTRLRETVRQGDVDIIIAYALDRLTRNQAHLGLIFSECDFAGVEVELVTEELHDTPEGRLLQSVRGFVAEIERLKIRERTQRGVRARVEQGRPIPGQKPPYGYRWRDKEKSGFEVDPVTAPIVRRIYDAVLGGRTLRSVANALTGEGIPTPTGRGKRWEVATLHCILKHPVYTGRAVAYRNKTVPRKGRAPRQVRRPESEQVVLPEGTAAALVTEAEFDAVQARLAANRASAPRNNANPEATLLRCGFARCGYCGRPLSITKRRGRPHMYRCHPLNRERHACPSFGISAPILDGTVWAEVKAFMTRDEIMSHAVQQRRGEDAFVEEIAALDRRLAEIARQRTNLARAVATLNDEEIAAPLLTELMALGEQRKALTAERETLVAQATAAEVDRQKLMDLDRWRRRVAGNLDRLTYQERRMVLEALGVMAYVYKADHQPQRIEVRLAPPPIEPLEGPYGKIAFSFPR